MATFYSWLTQHETGPDNDPVAWLARQWKALEGNRPRVSSPTGIERHLTGDQVAPADEPQHSQFIGYVQQAVAEATKRYTDDRAREQLGGSTVQASEQTAQAAQPALPGAPEPQGTNPVTGKPVAVLSAKDWIEHPLATKFGSCQAEGCGWALGVAQYGGKRVLTCAAGHVVNTGNPSPAEIDEAERLSQPATRNDPPAGEQAIDPEQVEEAADRVQEWQSGVDVLSMINFKLDALLTVLGLPTDTDALVAIVAQSAELDDNGQVMLSSQLAASPAQPERATFDQWWAAAEFGDAPQ